MNHNFEREIIIERATENALENTRANLGEFFQHFALVVQYEDGSILHMSDNDLVEKALYREALEMMREERAFEDCELEDGDLDWDDDDDDDSFLKSI